MIEFTTIGPDGEPLNTYQVPDDAHMQANIPTGMRFALGRPPDNSFFENGTWVAKPPRPSENHRWELARKIWVPDHAAQWAVVRRRRDALMNNTDWLVTKATETGQPMPEGWAAYRQALRDITGQPDVWNIQWPTPPN